MSWGDGGGRYYVLQIQNASQSLPAQLERKLMEEDSKEEEEEE